jgi:FixJ family two-component response regulator
MSGKRSSVLIAIVDDDQSVQNAFQAKLKADRCRIPIIFITAHGDAKMRIQAMRDGAVEFLTKPFDNDVLLETAHAAVKDYAKTIGLRTSNQ